MKKITQESQFREWVRIRLDKYDHSPSCLALMSYYVLDYSDYDIEGRRFTKLRAIAEEERGLYYQAKSKK